MTVPAEPLRPQGRGLYSPLGKKPANPIAVYFEDCEVENNIEDVELRPKARKRESLKQITVKEPFSVAHDGTAYFPGETPKVPASVADEWLRNQWVTK